MRGLARGLSALNTGNPTISKEQGHVSPPRTKLDDSADIRDILANMVGGGHTDLSNDSIKSDYLRLQTLLGGPAAQKMMDHIFIFNQRPDVQKKNAEQRLQQFYSMGSTQHEDINKILQGAKQIGYGPVVGLNTSFNEGNKMLSGRTPPAAPANSKIMDLLKKPVNVISKL